MQNPPTPRLSDTGLTPLAVRLRRATADTHEAVEKLPIMHRLTSDAVTGEDYLHYLTVLAGLYAMVETAIFRELNSVLCARLNLRRKLPALLRDLEEHGVLWTPPMENSSEQQNAHRYQPCGSNAVVGALYVLEGATLGGRTIARHLRRVLGAGLGSAHFLDFHGNDTAVAWRQFSTTLDELCREGALTPDEVIAGALYTFDAIYQRLQLTSPRH
jgi:heme oxygenase (biliverdin-IX-beta and delta-forming)